MSIPKYIDVRNRIDAVGDYECQMFLKSIYLLGVARPTELASKLDSGSTHDEIYGPIGNDVRIEQIGKPRLNHTQVLGLLSKIGKREVTIEEAQEMMSQKIEVAIFRIKKSRTQNRIEAKPYRDVALPIPFDPWVKELYIYFKKAGNNYVFQNSRTEYWRYTKENEVLKGLKYTIQDYTRIKKAISGRTSGTQAEHEKPLTLEGLRHVRYDELQAEYGFDDLDWGIFTGAQIRIGRSNPIFVEDWHRYIEKLCRKPSFVTQSKIRITDFQ
jgi:hypothetical protein